ncbi:MAG: ABC-F family ATP-binding cassette domain-containing protein [Lachnospiraceae bacterium]|nr:ABC-F family ATP-binding cassette domain-containing protein [Lachnospiraceae bacterium]
MILSCSHINKSFGTVPILKDAVFHINEHEKAAIVGINGAGKSTLLKIIIGEEPADSGEIIISKGRSIGYLAQHQNFSSDSTIYDTLLQVRQDILELEQKIRNLELQMKHKEGPELEELLETYAKATHAFEQAEGYAYKSEVTGVLKGLGFTEDDFTRQVNTLSGGQKTRVSLGRLLLTRPDIIMLDEPTNHLDLNSIAWLETFLLNYPGSVIIVSHDRYFLNRIVNKVVEIESGQVTMFSGNYSDYSAKKAQMREIALKAYMNQQQEIKHQEEVIAKLKSFNREKSIKRAESREKMLDKIERLDKPMTLNDSMHIEFHPAVISGNDVLTIKGLSKSFGSMKLFENADIEIRRGERVAIIGDNGTGKTTLLKIINEMLPADSGEIIPGSRVHIGYYDQEQQLLDENKTLFDELGDEFPSMTNTEIRNLLAAFLFTGDDVFKLVHDLSGGERGRLSLAKLMLSDANFLILDEPTNHLDIVSKEILENALTHYTGTVLFVSHDRYFINQTATRILSLYHGQFVNFLGNYDYYQEKAAEQFALADQAVSAKTFQSASAETIRESDTKTEWLAAKEAQAKERKRRNDLKKTEEQIQKLEERDNEINELLTQEEVYTNTSRLIELNKEQKEIAEKLELLYIQWEELAE